MVSFTIIGVLIHGRVQQLLLRIGAAQLEIVHRQFSMQTESGGLKIGGGSLRLLAGGGDSPADPAPQVNLVGKVEWQREARLWRWYRRWKENRVDWANSARIECSGPPQWSEIPPPG